jgi:hypothetical protein
MLANVLDKLFRVADADEQARSGRASCEKILGEMDLQSLAGEEPGTEVRLEESMDVGSDANAEVGAEEWSDDETQRDADAEDEARNADAVDDGVLSVGTMSEIAVNMNARDADDARRKAANCRRNAVGYTNTARTRQFLSSPECGSVRRSTLF